MLCPTLLLLLPGEFFPRLVFFRVLDHFLGTHAPGHHSLFKYFRVAHNELLGHGLALEHIRSISKNARVGLTLSLTPIEPASSNPKDIAAAKVANQFFNDFFLNAVFKGTYPNPLWRRIGIARPKVGANDYEDHLTTDGLPWRQLL